MFSCPPAHDRSQVLLDRLKLLEGDSREALERVGRGGEVEERAAKHKIAEFSATLAEASQFLAPYDVQALLATQRELLLQVQKIRAAKADCRRGAFTFKKKATTAGLADASPLLLPRQDSERAKRAYAAGDEVDAGGHRQGESEHSIANGDELQTRTIDASSIDPSTSSLVVENECDAEVRIRRLDVLQQVRVRDCENVRFKLYYVDGLVAGDNDKVVVEASRSLSFGFYDEASEKRIPPRTVRDFSWLKSGPSPNVSWIDDDCADLEGRVRTAKIQQSR